MSVFGRYSTRVSSLSLSSFLPSPIPFPEEGFDGKHISVRSLNPQALFLSFFFFLILIPVVLRPRQSSELPAGYVKSQVAGSHPRVSGSAVPGWGLRTHISNTFPDVVVWEAHFEDLDFILFCPGIDFVGRLSKSYSLIPADRALCCSGSIETFLDFTVRFLPLRQKIMMNYLNQ